MESVEDMGNGRINLSDSVVHPAESNQRKHAFKHYLSWGLRPRVSG